MKKLILKYTFIGEIAENIRFLICLVCRQLTSTAFKNNMLGSLSYNLFTTFPQKLWKTCKNPVCLKTCAILLCILVLFSCSSSKSAKKGSSALDNAVISMSEDEVRKKLGEPDIVSKTPENNIIWTYKPPWKIMPDNKGTIYIEFENGKVTKIVKAR
ncbi:MAG: hypothetical protein NT010_06845 [Proteobacteria bacterium]|nr:hypothetical protein [Pseudomonadota bacterium]